MSLETMIATVANQLAKQRRRSLCHEGTCQYRGANGSMCALGAVIPDDIYSPHLEGTQLDPMIWVLRDGGTFESDEEHQAVKKLLEYLPTLAPELTAGQVYTVLQAFQDFHDDDIEYEDTSEDTSSFALMLSRNMDLSEAEFAEKLNSHLTAIAQRVVNAERILS